jgi:hypothetical protein
VSVRARLIVASLSGCVFGSLTLVLIRFPDLSRITVIAWLQRLVHILLLPGFLVGYAGSRNIHVALTWVVVLANFLIYFGLVWVLLAARQKHGSGGTTSK